VFTRRKVERPIVAGPAHHSRIVGAWRPSGMSTASNHSNTVLRLTSIPPQVQHHDPAFSMLTSMPLIARGLATKAPKAPKAPKAKAPKGVEAETSSTPEAEQPEESTTPTPDDASSSAGPALEERSVEELQALIGEKNEALGECKAQARFREGGGVQCTTWLTLRVHPGGRVDRQAEAEPCGHGEP
jgi:hypothetical protein